MYLCSEQAKTWRAGRRLPIWSPCNANRRCRDRCTRLRGGDRTSRFEHFGINYFIYSHSLFTYTLRAFLPTQIRIPAKHATSISLSCTQFTIWLPACCLLWTAIVIYLYINLFRRYKKHFEFTMYALYCLMFSRYFVPVFYEKNTVL